MLLTSVLIVASFCFDFQSSSNQIVLPRPVKMLMTVTAATNLFMSGQHKRWLTVGEMISTQAFPVTADFTYGKPCSSYALRFEKRKAGISCPPMPSRHALCSQIGNSMHCACSGVMMLFCLTQIIMDGKMLSAQYFSLKKQIRMTEAKAVQPSSCVKHATCSDEQSFKKRRTT